MKQTFAARGKCMLIIWLFELRRPALVYGDFTAWRWLHMLHQWTLEEYIAI